MKTFITYTILLLLIAAMSSCLPRENVPATALSEESIGIDRWIKFEKEKHSWILIETSRQKALGGTIVHNPDCSCLNKHIIPLDNDTQ